MISLPFLKHLQQTRKMDINISHLDRETLERERKTKESFLSLFSFLCVRDTHSAGVSCNPTQSESDGVTQKARRTEKEKKNTHTSWVLSQFVPLLWQRLAGQRERGWTEEQEEKMKLHLFWWLTNDFEMWAALARRQNHFPNNMAWSLNKQNWDAALSKDTFKPSAAVCEVVGLHFIFKLSFHRNLKKGQFRSLEVGFCGKVKNK